MVLMYGRTEEDVADAHRESRGHGSATDADAEHLLRAFLAVPRASKDEGERK